MFLQNIFIKSRHGRMGVFRRGLLTPAAARRLQHSQSQHHDQAAAAPPTRPETSGAKTLMDIGTRRIFNEDHDLFRQSVRRFFQEEVIPHHKEWEKAGQVSREVWEKAGQQGLLGVMTPEKHGGIGGDLFSAVITWEEQMYSNCTGPGFALHSDIVMPYVINYGNREQVERFIPQLTAGTCISAIAMTEPGAGSDLQGVRTNAKRDGSDWILNGNKVFISNGWMADLVVVVAVTKREAVTVAHGISLFLVENGTKGFQKGRKLEKIGLKAQDTAELFFEDVRLPAAALLGEENRGFYYLMNELPQERLIVADMAIASCEFMFEETRNYVLQRKAFGKTIAQKRLDASSASMAKFWASDLQNKVATQCLQLHGGWGYMWEYPIAKAFVDSRIQPIYGGTNEIMKELIARTIVSQKNHCILLTSNTGPAAPPEQLTSPKVGVPADRNGRRTAARGALGLQRTSERLLGLWVQRERIPGWSSCTSCCHSGGLSQFASLPSPFSIIWARGTSHTG
ncbi:long-chain specific acyl-CoA dehydrogenase, mitochondrial-like isoform X2 [Synchiropus splendidus]|uniref:long-chain specific acyl-CoA dehydrogenase, mitochondrial-like isoform X2 n=1 Tax=Synchiropus splendidus TaxID=270530 RepID=UPI00237DA654|nr:long-chain specific acyl-CoA dehydrogenase, mitochondrial-like isoform X2 [Synchiropus splendidus]